MQVYVNKKNVKKCKHYKWGGMMRRIINLYGKLIAITTFLALLFQLFDLMAGNLNKLFIEFNLVGFNTSIMIIQIFIVVIKEFNDLLGLVSFKLYIYMTGLNIENNIESILKSEDIIRFNMDIKRTKLCVYKC